MIHGDRGAAAAVKRAQGWRYCNPPSPSTKGAICSDTRARMCVPITLGGRCRARRNRPFAGSGKRSFGSARQRNGVRNH